MVRAIPEGEHTVTPHLIIKGAGEAIEFYKRAFGATEVYRMPMATPDGGVRIGHAELRIGDSCIYLADEFPEYGSVGPSGPSPVSIHLYVEDADAVYNRAVEAGATAVAPPSDMFWGDRFGKLVDPFGHSWSIATHIEDVTPEQVQERMAAMSCAQPCPE
jgi:uncharacterized glyoxalase superfamily protein PhnB